MKVPHLLPIHILDILVLQEIDKIAKDGADVKLEEHKREVFLIYPFTIGVYDLSRFMFSKKEARERDFCKLQTLSKCMTN